MSLATWSDHVLDYLNVYLCCVINVLVVILWRSLYYEPANTTQSIVVSFPSYLNVTCKEKLIFTAHDLRILVPNKLELMTYCVCDHNKHTNESQKANQQGQCCFTICYKNRKENNI